MLKKLTPWLSVIMAVALITLYLTGTVEGPIAVALVAALEGGLLLWALWSVFTSFRRFKAAEGDRWKALETSLSGLMPAKAARLVIMEIRLWGGLHAWMRRLPHGPDEFTYHSRSQMGLVMGVLVLVTPLEIAVLELLIPWPWLRITTLVLALYGVLWVIMLFASLRSLPHRLETQGLRLRYGALAGAFIPYERIADAKVAMAKAPTHGDGLSVDKDAAFFAIDGETNLVIHLHEPLAVDKVLGETRPVRTIHFATDEPKRMIERLVSRLEPVEQPA